MPRPVDLLARAYATLELSPGCSRREAARQYKRLVKRWHPDRYANDPQGQAEAAQRMREINRAYTLVRQTPRVIAPPQPTPASSAGSEPSPRSRERYFGQRLTEAELEAIVAAMGTPSYFRVLMRYGFWAGSLTCAALLLLWSSRNPLNFVGGMLLASGAMAHLIRTMVREKR